MIALILATAMAQDDDFRGYVDQAKFLVQQGYWADALGELERAVTTEDGRIDPEAWYLLSEVRYHLGDLPGARTAASRAHSYARTDEQLDRASTFSTFLSDQFGLIHLAGSQPGLSTRVELALDGVLFDPELKRYVADLTERLDSGKSALPMTLGLPAGTYTVNGVGVTVQGSEETFAEIPVLGGGPVGLQLTRLELGLGMSAWFGAEAEGMLPGPHVQLAVNQPLGPLIVAVVADWSLRPYQTLTDGITASPQGASVGARVGYEIAIDRLLLRPSLGYRAGWIPGIERPCAAADGDFLCAPDSDPELLVYGVAFAHQPFAELAATVYDRRRTKGIGGGVLVSGEYALARLPSSAVATNLASGEDVPYVVDSASQSVRVVGLRALATLSLAF